MPFRDGNCCTTRCKFKPLVDENFWLRLLAHLAVSDPSAMPQFLPNNVLN